MVRGKAYSLTENQFNARFCGRVKLDTCQPRACMQGRKGREGTHSASVIAALSLNSLHCLGCHSRGKPIDRLALALWSRPTVNTSLRAAAQ